MSKKILIIEDEEDIQEILEFFVENMGYKVLKAKNGHEGQSMINSHSFDLVITDIFMSPGNGIEIANYCAEKSIPCIVSSANVANVADKVPASTLFLDKPFNEESLKSKVLKALDSAK